MRVESDEARRAARLLKRAIEAIEKAREKNLGRAATFYRKQVAQFEKLSTTNSQLFEKVMRIKS